MDCTELSTWTQPAVVKARTHLFLGANHQDIHHVTGISLLIGDTARNFLQEIGRDACDFRFDGTANGFRGRSVGSGIEHFDRDVEISFGGLRILVALIEADEEAAGDRNCEVLRECRA